jgi:hypothetical protein
MAAVWALNVGSVMPRGGGECEQVLSSFTKAGID